MSVKHPALSGLFIRFGSLLIGATVATGIIVSLQLPLLNKPAEASLSLMSITSSLPATKVPYAWPGIGSAAIDVPSMGVLESHNDQVRPIASLTKMMTTYVVLAADPLGYPAATSSDSGPCVVISRADVVTYEEIKAQGQSSAYVTEGEKVCERDLLAGLLVHSASNYAVLLANMVSGSVDKFVTTMNEDATILGLSSTHYVDVSGFGSGSVSTAQDQAQLAAEIMKSPLVRSIVIQQNVVLPVAGSVGTFTPFVGTNNVIGVKSGRTTEAGGCDVMAMSFIVNNQPQIAYAVVLGMQGGDLLTPAGEAALALDNSVVASVAADAHYTFLKNSSVGIIGWGNHTTSFGVAKKTTVLWSSTSPTLPMKLQIKQLTKSIHKGDVVAWLIVNGVKKYRIPLTAQKSATPPSLWQRLR